MSSDQEPVSACCLERERLGETDGKASNSREPSSNTHTPLQVYVVSRLSVPTVLQPHSYTHTAMPSLVFPSVLQSFSVTHRFVSLPLLHAMRYRIISRANDVLPQLLALLSSSPVLRWEPASPGTWVGRNAGSCWIMRFATPHDT